MRKNLAISLDLVRGCNYLCLLEISVGMSLYLQADVCTWWKEVIAICTCMQSFARVGECVGRLGR